MGALVGTSRQTISQIERGDYSPSVTLALKIAMQCGVKVEDIFEYIPDENEKCDEWDKMVAKMKEGKNNEWKKENEKKR